MGQQVFSHIRAQLKSAQETQVEMDHNNVDQTIRFKKPLFRLFDFCQVTLKCHWKSQLAKYDLFHQGILMEEVSLYY